MDSQSPDGDTPLHVAVRQCRKKDVRNILFQQQVDVNILNSKHETPLHLASSSACVQLLIAFGADPFIKDSNNKTAYGRCGYKLQTLMNKLLYCYDLWINSPTQIHGDTLLRSAVNTGNLYDIKRIIEFKNVDVNVLNASHETPLHLACTLGDRHKLHTLISSGANIYIRDCYNNAPIHRAVSQGHVDIVDCLITDYVCDPNVKGYQGRTLLHFSCVTGNIDLIATLIEKHGISPMATDAVNQTPLHIAASHGREEIVCLLISKYNCPVDCRSNYSLSPLHLACYCGHVSVVKTLVFKYKADVNALDEAGSTPFIKAINGGNLNVVDMILTCFNLDPLSAVDDSGNTPLHIACEYGHKKLARLFITKYNCPVDVKNKISGTPLHTACLYGHLRIVRMLVSEFKADMNAHDHKNDTPLIKAAQGQHIDLVQMLITEFGCSPHVKGFKGRSLLHHACDRGHIKLAMALITKFGLCPLSADINGDTPLHLTCLRGLEGLARLLITKYKCRIHVRNKNNETPLHKASSAGHVGIVRMLVSEFKADMNARDYENDTPLFKAALSGHTDLVQMLITEFGCSPHVKGFEGRSLLHHACDKGHTKLAMILITKFNIDPLSVDDCGDRALHMACWSGHEELARLLITKYNTPVHVRNKNIETPLHVACSSGHIGVVRMLVSEFKADMTARENENDTPLIVAALGGHTDLVQMLITEFGCNPRVKGFEGRSLLHQVCDRGHTELFRILITEFDLDPLSVDDRGNSPLHIACWFDHEELARLLINKYNCPVNVRNKNNETPLHKACSSGHLGVSRMLILEFKADMNAREHQNDTPLIIAVLGGHTDLVRMLITEFGCSPQIKGFEGRSLLHAACEEGNTVTAKTLIGEFPSLIHFTDVYGNSPLHHSSTCGQAESVRLLLKYHVPIFIRNKAGKTAVDIAYTASVKKIFKEYMSNEYNLKGIQQEYEKLQTLSLKKYAGHQIITRVFVLGYPGSGKSTLVESLKRKGVISSRLLVTEADVPPHTAGIIPSTYESKKLGRLLYYDFAGDGEYYSSHAAILEMVSQSTVGTNVYLIVANLKKDCMTLSNEIGYWLSFISYHVKILENQQRLNVVVVLSHSDCLSLADSTNKLDSIRQYLENQKEYCNRQKLDIIDILSSNCRRPCSSEVIKNTLLQVSRSAPSCSISFASSLLHGLLQKDFGNVVACKFRDLLSHIKDTGICLPTVASALYPLLKELHDVGVLMMVGRDMNKVEDSLLLLNPSSLTNEVHQRLFSDSARQEFNSSVSPYYASMGILPESYLTSILPEYITKESLIQLQYCQEFCHAEVGLNYLVTPDDALNNHLLYFPALCMLESEQSDWPTNPKLTFSIGWYTKCTGKFNYFPARYLHVVLLRLAFTFALPRVANCNASESNEVSTHNRRCTMWKNGIRWLMEEGVECIFEMVNDNKGIVIITKSEEHSTEWAVILSKIIDKVMQAKAEFCDRVSLEHFLLNSNDTSSFVYEDKLFGISDVARVIREGKKKVISVSGQAFLDSSHLCVLKKYTYWGQYFPISMPKVLSHVKAIIQEWEQLGIALQIPYEILREIDADKALVASKKEEMIAKWMDSPGPACWWLLVKALEEIDQNVAAAAIRTEQGEAIEIQQKLIEGGDQKPDDVFLQSFARVVGDHWPSLASLLFITVREIEEIKREEKEQQALCMLSKWSTKEATFKQLHQKLQTVYLFRC